MRIQTFSIVAGSEACNARCPFCVSKMTVPNGVGLREPEVHWRNFRKACDLARRCGVTTVMITGKGEPALFPEQITRYLSELRDFPIVELQTNGIPKMPLRTWYELGLTTVAISMVHYEPERNREVYLPYAKSYIDLAGLIRTLHEHGLSVRLACVMARGFIDAPEPLSRLIAFAKENRVEQLTVRPVNRPLASRDSGVERWSADHAIDVAPIQAWLEANGARLLTLPHGAVVYDVGGQNVCLTDSLTPPKGEDLRQLIFFPDGHLRYDWQYEGAVLL